MLKIHKKESHLYKYDLEDVNSGVYDAESRYFNYKFLKCGDITDSVWIESWERPEIPESDDDMYIEYQENQNNRLDLISFKYYGTVKLWWAIAVANDIQNPFEKIEKGTILRIPIIANIPTMD